ncbi:diguanylate cyclase [Paraburkholderia sp. LEh10]|nr:diguanylate cyclase [Paraburkholderia sp. LEh10]
MHPAQLILMYGVIPLWLAAGVADWACHKATSIESTTGTKESLIHILMLVEVGIPLVAALLLQINAALIATMFAAFALHEATALWDVSFASRSMRRVSPFEQHVHSYLELTPLLAIVCVAILHWPEVVALLDADAVADFRLRFKAHPLPAAYLAVTFACIACFGVFPFVEELWRCLRSKRQLHGSRPSHARAQ